MSFKDKNEFITCPFDAAHTIHRGKLLGHIVKCMKNLPPNHDFVECEYNSSHYVKRNKLAEHYQVCEYKQTSVSNQVIWNAEPARFLQPTLVVDPNVASNTEESWDQSGPCFQPENFRQNAPHMIVPSGLTKKERRDFRDKERERLKHGTEMPTTEVEEPTDIIVPRIPEIAPKLQGYGRIAANFQIPEEVEMPNFCQGTSATSSYRSALEGVSSSQN